MTPRPDRDIATELVSFARSRILCILVRIAMDLEALAGADEAGAASAPPGGKSRRRGIADGSRSQRHHAA